MQKHKHACVVFQAATHMRPSASRACQSMLQAHLGSCIVSQTPSEQLAI